MTRSALTLLDELIIKMEEDATQDVLDDMIPDAMADAEEEVLQDLVDTIYNQYGFYYEGK